MKKLILPVLATFIAAGLLSSCAKTTSTPAPSPTVSGVSASLNGTTWTAAAVALTKNSTSIIINGTKADGTYLKIALPPDASTGKTYTMPSSGLQDFQYFDTNTNFDVSTGTISITNYNTSTNIMTGTFSGTIVDPSNGSNKKTVTNGTFTAVF